MQIIDENGDVLGAVNAVDAAAVAVVLSLGVAAFLGVSGAGDDSGRLTQVVTVESVDVDSTVADRIEPGPVTGRDVVEVVNASTRSAPNGSVLVVEVRLPVTTTDDGLVTYRGDRLFIGRTLSLELDGTTLTGVVTGAREPERIDPVPTPTTTTGATTTTTMPTTTTTPDPGRTRVLLVRANATPAAVEGAESGEGILSVEVSRIRDDGGTTTVALTVRVDVTVRNGRVYFRGVELGVGRRILFRGGAGTFVGTVEAVRNGPESYENGTATRPESPESAVRTGASGGPLRVIEPRTGSG